MLYIRILSVAICLVAFANAAVNWRMYFRTGLPGTVIWAIAGTSIFLGMTVFALNLVDASVTIMLGNSLILIGFAVLWHGARRFAGYDFSPWLAFVSLVIFCVVILTAYWLSVVKPSMVLRGAIVSAGMAVFSLMAGNTLFVCRFGSRAVTLTGAVFSFYAVFNGIRMLHAVVEPGPNSIMASMTFIALYFLVSLIFILCLTIGQVCMVREAMTEDADGVLSCGDAIR